MVGTARQRRRERFLRFLRSSRRRCRRRCRCRHHPTTQHLHRSVRSQTGGFLLLGRIAVVTESRS